MDTLGPTDYQRVPQLVSLCNEMTTLPPAQLRNCVGVLINMA